MVATVLVVEDDPRTAELLRLYLERDGCKVVVSGDGLEGLRLARERRPDLILLDLMLPGLDGLELCRAVRQESEVPIIMVTARVEEEDRLEGLDLGADDYVTKPFSPREVAARVRAVLRRTSRDIPGPGPTDLAYGHIAIDLKRRTVQVRGEAVRLTPTEFRLLAMLMREPQRTFTREQIIDRVHGERFDGFDRAVDAHVSSLRRKLRNASGDCQPIHTIYGVGYRLGDG